MSTEGIESGLCPRSGCRPQWDAGYRACRVRITPLVDAAAQRR